MFLQTLCLSSYKAMPKSVKQGLSLLLHIREEISILTKNGIWLRKRLLFSNLLNRFFYIIMPPSQNRRLWSQIREMRPIVGRFGLHSRWLGKNVSYDIMLLPSLFGLLGQQLSVGQNLLSRSTSKCEDCEARFTS